jgi:hypothetical protein
MGWCYEPQWRWSKDSAQSQGACGRWHSSREKREHNVETLKVGKENEANDTLLTWCAVDVDAKTNATINKQGVKNINNWSQDVFYIAQVRFKTSQTNHCITNW